MSRRAVSVGGGVAALLAVAGLTGSAAAPAPPRVVDLRTARALRITVPPYDRLDVWRVVTAAGVGDVTGDGRADVAVTVERRQVPADWVENVRSCVPDDGSSPSGRRPVTTRWVQIVPGGPGRLVDLSQPLAGGFRIDGPPAADRLGDSVSRAGDVDGDGVADLVVGAPGTNARNGAAYVVFGRRRSGDVDVRAFGERGIRIDGGRTGETAGEVVLGAGDVDGDGRPDLLVGSTARTPQRVAQIRNHCVGFDDAAPPHAEQHVVSVVRGGPATAISTTALSRRGYAIGGSQSLEPRSWDWLAAPGDVDGDRRADILLALRDEAVVLAGGPADGVVDLDGRRPLVRLAPPPDREGGDVLGVAAAGDGDGDGRADVAVTIRSGSGRGDRVYVVAGRRARGLVRLVKPPPGVTTIVGDTSGGVGALGDVDGDGRHELAVGAARTPLAPAFVLRGAAARPRRVVLPRLPAGGYRLDEMGRPGWAGDVDGDGRGDALGQREGLGGRYSPVVVVALAAPGPQPRRPRRVAVIRGLGAAPIGLARGEGALWATTVRAGAGHLWRLDPRTGRPARGPSIAGRWPHAVAAGRGAVWVLDHPENRRSPGHLLRISPRTGRILSRTTIPGIRNEAPFQPSPERLAVGAGGVWLARTFTGTVVRFDPATGRQVAVIRVGPRPTAPVVAHGAVWVADDTDGHVRRIDPATNQVDRVVRVTDPHEPLFAWPGEPPRVYSMAMAATASALWTYDLAHDDLRVLSPAGTTARPVGEAGSRVRAESAAVAGDTLWLGGRAVVARVSLRSGRIVGQPRPEVGRHLAALADARGLWTDGEHGRLARFVP